jgi:hypothetical protein
MLEDETMVVRNIAFKGQTKLGDFLPLIGDVPDSFGRYDRNIRAGFHRNYLSPTLSFYELLKNNQPNFKHNEFQCHLTKGHVF